MFCPGKKAFSLNNKQRIHKSVGLEASLIACIRRWRSFWQVIVTNTSAFLLLVMAHIFKCPNTIDPRQNVVIPAMQRYQINCFMFMAIKFLSYLILASWS